VLEIGAGGNPYPRANVLLDAYETTNERIEPTLVSDRPLVLAHAEDMPFRDGAFDFAIASHVLEHSRDPEAFLRELLRVARAGYIETPDAFFERINPFTFHTLEVTDSGGTLRIWKKPSWRPGGDVVDLFEARLKRLPAFFRWGSRFPDPFNVRFYWRGRIDYEIVNPDQSLDWSTLSTKKNPPPTPGRLRRLALAARRRLFSQGTRNRALDVSRLLRCPSCRAEGAWRRESDRLVCSACTRTCPVSGNIYRMT
jgi:SAM-dependent methyltransferase